MATMNISLPDGMKEWVEQQASSSYYSNSSDYIRDLIRNDQLTRVERFQSLIIEGIDSGTGNRSMSDLKGVAKDILNL